jgi:hypothetical protein
VAAAAADTGADEDGAWRQTGGDRELPPELVVAVPRLAGPVDHSQSTSVGIVGVADVWGARVGVGDVGQVVEAVPSSVGTGCAEAGGPAELIEAACYI